MRNLEDVARIVVKIGTSCLSSADTIDSGYVQDICLQISHLASQERRVLVVTSGAIGMGAREIGLQNGIANVVMRQACAAIGQPLLMQVYRQAFADVGIRVAQVLLTSDVLANRKSYLNLRSSVESLLSLGVVPIFNENDSVATDEIGSAFGDNDTLSAYVASKIDADLLIMLTDIDALYDRDPRRHADARPIDIVEKITPEIRKSAGAAGSTFARGGMKTKIRAAEIAGKAGCRTIIANGRTERVLERLLAGESIGTLFLAQPALTNRQRWILNSKPAGRLTVDDGALAAIRRHKSLLPSGVTSIDGVFKAGDVVLVNEVVKLVTTFNSTELESILGKHSAEIHRLLGKSAKEVIARPENMVFLDT